MIVKEMKKQITMSGNSNDSAINELFLKTVESKILTLQQLNTLRNCDS